MPAVRSDSRPAANLDDGARALAIRLARNGQRSRPFAVGRGAWDFPPCRLPGARRAAATLRGRFPQLALQRQRRHQRRHDRPADARQGDASVALERLARRRRQRGSRDAGTFGVGERFARHAPARSARRAGARGDRRSSASGVPIHAREDSGQRFVRIDAARRRNAWPRRRSWPVSTPRTFARTASASNRSSAKCACTGDRSLFRTPVRRSHTARRRWRDRCRWSSRRSASVRPIEPVSFDVERRRTRPGCFRRTARQQHEARRNDRRAIRVDAAPCARRSSSGTRS